MLRTSLSHSRVWALFLSAGNRPDSSHPFIVLGSSWEVSLAFRGPMDSVRLGKILNVATAIWHVAAPSGVHAIQK